MTSQPQPPLPGIAQNLARLVATVISEIRPRLIEAALSGERSENRNLRHSDNFLSSHDLWMHRRYQELLAEIIPSFVYASEEADPQIVGDDPDPDLCVLVDPLDTSELAVRALYGYTHVMVYSRSLARPVAAVVGDIFHHLQIYLAARDDAGQDQAFLFTQTGTRYALRLNRSAELNEALITNYLMKPTERFQPLARKSALMEELSRPSSDGVSRGRVGVDFGSVSLCHIAAGFTDAVIEFAKGFAVWDLAPGHYILNAAGGVVLDLQGQPIPLDYQFGTVAEIVEAMDRRDMFVAASSLPLAQDILATLGKQ
ncbi:myo-inositol-1(or 4)-monophosphatase [Thermocatellispora tengchongensis]|uniref:Myo-inositol-1(Or 4)-monophosphatase n=1 Tax=Thermocatellispora tengchongensis TaxID=1073253 RepID=A0A840PQG2_9ACTN|nr:inositol monophosphatase family protein [Thermocatellispora tengchongensis]MBB5140011.1 myo-inositol-1(or 4)-monophosphatase [Thermocatellispora tengchongensis]